MVDVYLVAKTFIIAHYIEVIVGITVWLVLAALILLIVLIRRKPQDIVLELKNRFSELESKQIRLENVIKDEITRNRQETTHNAQLARQELSTALKISGDSLQQVSGERNEIYLVATSSVSVVLAIITRFNLRISSLM